MKSTKNRRRIKNEASEMNAALKSNKLNVIIICFIIIYAFMIFYDAINFDFVLWDDNSYVTGNLLIRDLSIAGLKKILTTPIEGMYNPLIFLIYALEYKFWGFNPKVFHFINIIFHLIAIGAVYGFIFKLTKRFEAATIAALMFAIHPMHVSAVVWVSEIKTSLFLIFYFLALSNYIKYVQNNFNVKYLLYVALLFIVSALSKPEAVTLAPMLFLLDYYLSRKISKGLFFEKIPFFLIAIFFGFLTLYTHSNAGDSIFDVNPNYSFINNLLIANYSLVFYINKLFIPLNLCTIYPYPDSDVFLPLEYYLSLPVIPLLFLLVYKSGVFKKEIVFGLLFFVISISVVLRIMPSGFFGVANRYSYLSYTGLFFIVGQYYCYVKDGRFPYSKKIINYLTVFLCILIIFFSYRTTVRIKVWENSLTLFDDIIKKKPKLSVAYHNRGLAKQAKGNVKGAIEDLEMAIKYDSNYVSAYNNLGEFKWEVKDENAAVKNYLKALSLDPKSANVYCNMAVILFNHKKYKEAMFGYNMAIKYNPEMGQAYHNKAVLEIELQDTAAALKDLKKAVELGHKLSVEPYRLISANYFGNYN